VSAAASASFLARTGVADAFKRVVELRNRVAPMSDTIKIVPSTQSNTLPVSLVFFLVCMVVFLVCLVSLRLLWGRAPPISQVSSRVNNCSASVRHGDWLDSYGRGGVIGIS